MVHNINLGLANKNITKRFQDGLKTLGMILNKDLALQARPREEVVLDLSRSSGAALTLGERVQLLGSTPIEADVLALRDWLIGSHVNSILYTTQLARYYSRTIEFTEKVSGLLAVCIDKARKEYLMLFKPPLDLKGADGVGDDDTRTGGLISAPWTVEELVMASRLKEQLRDARQRSGQVSVVDHRDRVE